MREVYYELEDGSIWSTIKADFIDPTIDEDFLKWKKRPDSIISKAPDITGKYSLIGLKNALVFYGFSLGTLNP